MPDGSSEPAGSTRRHFALDHRTRVAMGLSGMHRGRSTGSGVGHLVWLFGIGRERALVKADHPLDIVRAACVVLGHQVDPNTLFVAASASGRADIVRWICGTSTQRLRPHFEWEISRRVLKHHGIGRGRGCFSRDEAWPAFAGALEAATRDGRTQVLAYMTDSLVISARALHNIACMTWIMLTPLRWPTCTRGATMHMSILEDLHLGVITSRSARFEKGAMTCLGGWPKIVPSVSRRGAEPTPATARSDPPSVSFLRPSDTKYPMFRYKALLKNCPSAKDNERTHACFAFSLPCATLPEMKN